MPKVNRSRLIFAMVSIAIAAGSALSAVTFTQMPQKLQLYGRDFSGDSGTVTIAGTSGGAVSVKVYRNGTLLTTQNGAAGSFSIACRIKAELASYKFEVYEGTTLASSADSVVCGDVYLVSGQSNASIEQPEAGVNKSPWIRTLGSNDHYHADDRNWYLGHGDPDPNRDPNSPADYGSGCIGAWGSRIAKLIVDNQKIPVAFFNGATSGMEIAYFQKSFPPSQDQFNGLINNYTRLLNRVKAAGLTAFVRAAFWHQGEADCGWGEDGQPPPPHPTMQGYVDLFKALKDSWFADYPNMQKVHPFQLGALCGEAWIWEAHRQLEIQIPNVQVMSASNCDHSDGCHYNYVAGYDILGLNMYRLIAHDFYGSNDTASITPPSLTYVQRSGAKELALVMKKVNDPLTWKEGSQKSFTLYGASGALTTKVLSGTTSGNTLKITLDGNSAVVTAISFLGKSFPNVGADGGYGADPLVYNANNIGALYFDRFPVEPVTSAIDIPGLKAHRSAESIRMHLSGRRGMTFLGGSIHMTTAQGRLIPLSQAAYGRAQSGAGVYFAAARIQEPQPVR